MGIGVEGQLRPTSPGAPGTSSARGEALLRDHFGDSAPFAILLRGPAAAIDRQGPELVRALRKARGATTLSPWDRGTLEPLRPSPRKAPDPRRLPSRRRGVGRARGPRSGADSGGDGPPAGRRHAVRLRHALAGAAGRIARSTRTRRADRDPAAPDRPAARLPLAGRGGDPARLRRAAVFADPRRPRPARLRVRDRRLLARRLHDDGARPRGRLLAVDRLPLPRGARRRGRRRCEAARRTRRDRRPHHRCSPAPPCSLAMAVTLWVMPGSLLLSLAGPRSCVTPSASLIASLALPAAARLLGPSGSTAAIGSSGERERLMAVRRAPRCAGRASRRPLVARCRSLLLAAAGARPSTPGPRAPTSCRPRAPPARTPKRSADAVGARLGRTVRRSSPPRTEGPITTARPPRPARARPAQDRRRPRGAGGDRPGPDRPPGRAAAGRRQRTAGRRRRTPSPGKLARLGPQTRHGRGRRRPPARRPLPGRRRRRPARDRLGSRRRRRRTDLADGTRRRRRGRGPRESTHSAASTRARRSWPRVSAAPRSAPARAARRTQRPAAGHPSRPASTAPAACARDLARGGGNRPRPRRRGRTKRERLARIARARRATRPSAPASSATPPPRRPGAGSSTGGDAAAPRRRAARRSRRPLPGGLERLGTRRRPSSPPGSNGSPAAPTLSHAASPRAPSARARCRRARAAPASGSPPRPRGSSEQVGALRHSSPQIFDSGYFVLSALDGRPPSGARGPGRSIDLEHGGQAARMLVIPRYTFNTPGSARLDRAAAGATRRRSPPQPACGPGVDRRRRAAQRLRRRDLRARAAGDRRDHPRHLPHPRPGPAGAAARRARRRPQPALGRAPPSASSPCSARSPPATRSAATTISTRSAPPAIFGVTFGLSIDYAVFLLARMRESHDAGGEQRAGDRLRAREDRRGDHRRRRDHGRRLRLLRRRADRHRQPAGHRPHRRGPARRDRGPHRAAAGADAAARRARLVAAARPRASVAAGIGCVTDLGVLLEKQ